MPTPTTSTVEEIFNALNALNTFLSAHPEYAASITTTIQNVKGIVDAIKSATK